MRESDPDRSAEDVMAPINREVLAAQLKANGIDLAASAFRTFSDQEIAEFIYQLAETRGFDPDEILKAAWKKGENDEV